jgi:hypothetical protein
MAIELVTPLMARMLRVARGLPAPARNAVFRRQDKLYGERWYNALSAICADGATFMAPKDPAVAFGTLSKVPAKHREAALALGFRPVHADLDATDWVCSRDAALAPLRAAKWGDHRVERPKTSPLVVAGGQMLPARAAGLDSRGGRR